MSDKQYKLVRVKKLEERTDATHPNNIEVDREFVGTFREEPKVDERFNIGYLSNAYNERGLSTSRVVEILTLNTFKTLNSIYQWEIIDEENS